MLRFTGILTEKLPIHGVRINALNAHGVLIDSDLQIVACHVESPLAFIYIIKPTHRIAHDFFQPRNNAAS